jgi:hypothetical protein
VYRTRSEKGTDFILGIVLFIAINIVLIALVPFALSIASQNGSMQNSNIAFAAFFFALACFVDFAAIIYFALTRSWVAMGMLTFFALAFAIPLIFAALFAAFCFNPLNLIHQ